MATCKQKKILIDEEEKLPLFFRNTANELVTYFADEVTSIADSSAEYLISKLDSIISESFNVSDMPSNFDFYNEVLEHMLKDTDSEILKHYKEFNNGSVDHYVSYSTASQINKAIHNAACKYQAAFVEKLHSVTNVSGIDLEISMCEKPQTITKNGNIEHKENSSDCNLQSCNVYNLPPVMNSAIDRLDNCRASKAA